MNKRSKKCRTEVKPGCRATGPLLFDYASRAGKLGKADRESVRKHLADCPNCRLAVTDISAVVGILRSASRAESAPDRLSSDRRMRLLKLVSRKKP